MNKVESLIRRLSRLQIRPQELEFWPMLQLLQESEAMGYPDLYSYEILDELISEVEAGYVDNPFPVIPESKRLSDGISVLESQDGNAIGISLTSGATKITHGCVFGGTGSGKSFLQAKIVSALSDAGECFTLVLDTTRTFRNITEVWNTHTFIRFSDLRLNPWDEKEGVSSQVLDQVISNEFCDSYNLKFAEYEINEVVSLLREKKKAPCFPIIKRMLVRKSYQSFSRRSQYRDSAVLVLQNFLGATGEVFNCQRGMDLRSLLSNNLVLELDILPAHQAFVLRLVFSILSLIPLGLGRPLLVVVDEGQVMFE